MIVGIIAEYNPFHNGHKYQIEQIRKKYKDAAIIAVMSGNFTQRGEPAILNKFTRAELAVNGGCDLVLELPFIYAVRSAQDFAFGSINLLKKIGIVDVLAFGAEINDIDLLNDIANKINTIKFNEIIKNKLNNGISYAKASCQTLSELTDIPEKLLRLPNTILAIEYLRALKSTQICPFLIPRISASYNDNQLYYGISSASAIRNSIYSDVPDWKKIALNVNIKTLFALKNTEFPLIENLYRPIIAKIICNSKYDLEKIYGMNEGLENKIINAATSTKNFYDFINNVVSQRYTRSRIQRLMLYLLLDLKKDYILKFKSNTYARILAFNQYGRKLLKQIRNNSSIPIVNKITQHINSRIVNKDYQNLEIYQQILRFDINSTNIFSLLYPSIQLNQDFLNSPLYIK